MTLTEIIVNHVFNKGTEILADGSTIETVRKALTGIDTVITGLSDAEMRSMIEGSTPLKSYVDKHTSEGIKTREKTLNTEIDTNKRKHAEEIKTFETTINTLKSSQPVSGNPEELRKQALDEVDPLKREMLNLKAKSIETDKKLADMKASDLTKDGKLTKETLLNIVRAELGERHITKTMSDNLDMLIGVDEETTKGKVKIFNDEWDIFTKDMKTAGADTTTPPAGGEGEVDGEAAMLEKMNKKTFL